MSAQPMSNMSRTIRWEAWQLSEEADRRFRQIVLSVGIPALILMTLVRLYQLETPAREVPGFDSSQYVELLPDAGDVAPEPEEPKPADENKPEPPKQAKPAPVKPLKPDVKLPTPVKPVESARDVAAKSGILALSKELNDLRDSNVSDVTTDQPLNTAAITSKGGIGASGGAAAIAASAQTGSGGIGGSGNADVTSSQSGNGVGTRRTGAVKSPLGTGTVKPKGGDAPAAGRTPSEIQAVFNKNQSPFYAIFNRVARENANIGRGKIVVRLTVNASGAVTACSLVSSTYNEPDFENKVIERVKLLNFGAKNVPDFSMDYPINFIPQ